MTLRSLRFGWRGTAVAMVAATLLATAPAAGAQTGAVLELSVSHASMSGDDFTAVDKKVDPGIGIELSGGAMIGSRFLLTVGLRNVKHETDYAEETGDKLGMTQIFGELRAPLPQTGRITPYLSLRIGLITASQELVLTDDNNVAVRGVASQSGPAFGGGAGVMINLGYRAGLVVGATWQSVSLGDVDFEGSHVGDSKLSGSTLSIRVGGVLDFRASR